MEVQFIPMYVNPPKPGKKWGSIKDAGGTRYIIPGGSESLFAKDQPVNIRWETAAWTDTGLVRAVNGAQLNEPVIAPGLAPIATAAPAPLPATPVAAAPANPLPPSAPTTAPAQGPIINGRYTDQQRAEDIFVTGVVGRVLGGSSGNFGLTDIGAIAKAAVQAWRERNALALPAGVYTETNPPPPGPSDAR